MAEIGQWVEFSEMSEFDESSLW